MTTHITVSRTFEPVPQMKVEAQYDFAWINGEFDHAELQMKRVNPNRSTNTRFDKVKDIPLEDVPDAVVTDARATLMGYADGLSETNDG